MMIPRWFVMLNVICVLLYFMLAGCKYNVPVSQFDEGIDQLCEGGLQEYKGHQFMVHLMDSYGEVRVQCDGHDACTNGNAVWVIGGPKCPKYMAHEVGHIIGNKGVDAYHGD